MQGQRPESVGQGYGLTRALAAAALLIAAVLAAVVLLGGEGGHRYRLLFETGGQLVPGNLVQVGGVEIGSIDDVTLTDDAQAEVEITVEEPLHEGTIAVVRATSLSGIANRYISLSPGPNSEPEIPEDGLIPADRTTSPVDLDQLFNTFDARTRRALQDFIQGQATVYTGNSEEANETYKYFAPGLQSTTRLLAELNRDQVAFTRFLVEGADTLGALASRSDDLSALTENANRFLGAIAARNDDLDRSLSALPPAMRQANTTFVNLRAALDDLDPLVADAKVGTRDLAPFLRDVQPVAAGGVPAFRDLALAVSREGPANDLTDALRDTPGAEQAAGDSVPVTLAALDDSQPTIEVTRPYSPDILGLVSKLGQVTGYYDASGHYARVFPASQNLFNWSGGTLTPIPPADQFDFYFANEATLNTLGPFERCPGASTQPNPGWPTPTDHPFLDDGALDGKCDPADVPPGP